MIPWVQSLKFRPRLQDFYHNPLLRLRMALLLGAFILTGGTGSHCTPPPTRAVA